MSYVFVCRQFSVHHCLFIILASQLPCVGEDTCSFSPNDDDNEEGGRGLLLVTGVAEVSGVSGRLWVAAVELMVTAAVVR